jgi:hypothetical protein
MPLNELAINLRIHPLAAIWAEAYFDNALACVSAQRDKCFSILEFLYEEDLIQSKVPDKDTVKPSFYALTIEPRCEAYEIERILVENGWTCKVCGPAIFKPIYHHESYIKLSHSKRFKQKRCPIAEEQCRDRVRIVFSQPG